MKSFEVFKFDSRTDVLNKLNWYDTEYIFNYIRFIWNFFFIL